MRRALIFVILLLACALIAGATYLAYRSHSEELQMDDLVSKDHVLFNGEYGGSFRCEKPHRSISGYTYKIKGNSLYLTLLIKPTGYDALETDEQGYVHIELDGLEGIEHVYYIDDDNERELA